MPFELKYTPEAQAQYNALEADKSMSVQFTAVKKALRFLAADPTHPGLHTHKYDSLEGPEKSVAFEAYAQNKTPGAYRIFWCYYPPDRSLVALGTITIIAITPHP